MSKAQLYSGKIETGVSNAIDLAQKEVPELVKEFIVFRTWKHAITALLFITLFVSGSVLVKKCVSRDWRNASGDVSIMAAIFVSSALLFIGIEIYRECLNLIQVIVAPRVYMLEQVIELIKTPH